MQALAAVYAKITIIVLAEPENNNHAGVVVTAVDAAAINSVLKMPSDVAHGGAVQVEYSWHLAVKRLVPIPEPLRIVEAKDFFIAAFKFNVCFQIVPLHLGSAPPIPPDLFDVVVVSPDSAGVRVDVSPPAAAAYRAFLKLQAATGGGAVASANGGAHLSGGDGTQARAAVTHCTVIHVAGGGSSDGGGGGGRGSPGVAHYAVAARRQTLALRGVPVLAHFGAQTSARRRADQRVEVETVEELEVDFMVRSSECTTVSMYRAISPPQISALFQDWLLIFTLWGDMKQVQCSSFFTHRPTNGRQVGDAGELSLN
jgi:hypothetical protein